MKIISTEWMHSGQFQQCSSISSTLPKKMFFLFYPQLYRLQLAACIQKNKICHNENVSDCCQKLIENNTVWSCLTKKMFELWNVNKYNDSVTLQNKDFVNLNTKSICQKLVLDTTR